MRYLRQMVHSLASLQQGLLLSAKHLKAALGKPRRRPVAIAEAAYFEAQEGIVTLNYPYEQLPVPDNGRYKLHNEIDDCIVCDKCAKICPVDCIEIEAIKAPAPIGTASDGTPIRLYAAKFDIDMAKCCFCGLCTTVCPTECLTMTPDYDFSVFDLKEMNFPFAKLSAEEAAQKRAEAAEHAARQAAAKQKASEQANSETAATPPPPATETPAPKPRPMFKRPAPPKSE